MQALSQVSGLSVQCADLICVLEGAASQMQMLSKDLANVLGQVCV